MSMPFIVLGAIILITGILLFRMAKKSGDPEGLTGSIGLIIAGILFIFVIGIFYQMLF